MKAIIVHGGVGELKKDRVNDARAGVQRAVEAGFSVLESGGDAIDACEKAVNVLEDDPVFNAGTGSALTLDGQCAMDASIMRGSTLEVGAVADVRNVKNPISLARKVMEETDHVLLVGEGAEKFARIMGFPPYDPITEDRKREWEALREKVLNGRSLRHWKKLSELIRKHPEILHGTVGCVALDEKGEIAAGTSTGGVFLKLFGRVGDTPIPGAGTYATIYGGASATGIGEAIMRTLLAKTVVDFMKIGLSAQKAAEAGIDLINNTTGLMAGIITIDRTGKIGFAHNARDMIVAFINDEMQNIQIKGIPEDWLQDD